MLPHFLRSSYKEYKADSEAVANWLATTARARGYKIVATAQDAGLTQKVPKLKGRARKLARDAARSNEPINVSQPEAASSSETRLQHLIPVSDFVKFAKFIADTKPRLQVHKKIFSRLRKAIDERKRHYVYHADAKKSSSGSAAANDGHSYFISILEKVWEILEPYFVRDSPIEQHASDSQFANSSEELTVEDSVDIPEVQSPIDESTPQPDAPLEFGVKQDAESELEEAFFAWQCLLDDYNRLRCYLRDVWKNYNDGFFDLTAASVVSNTAIDFARGIEVEFVSLFPNADIQLSANMMYCACCLNANTTPDYKERRSDDMNFLVYEAVEPTLFPTYTLLSSFTEVLHPKQLPTIKPGFFGIYDASSDRSRKSGREKFLEDKIVLLEALPEFTVIAESSDRILAEDEITRGMRELVKTKKVHIWFTLACQVFLDIHHVLRKNITNGLYDLHRSATFIKAGISTVIKFHKDLRIDTWPKSNDKVLADIIQYIDEWVKDDMIGNTRSRILGRASTNLPRPETFFLLKQHPLLCGLMSFTLRLQFQEAGITFANAWGSTLFTTHLYNAVRQEKLLTKAWKDMNLILLFHDIEKMFVGNYPNTHEDYFKRYCLAMGVSATAFAKDNSRSLKDVKSTESKSGPRSLDEPCPVSRMFRQRYCEQSGLLTLSPNDVERILEEHADEEDLNDYIEDEDGWVTPNIKITTPSNPHSIDQRNPKRTIEAGLRPIQLLNTLLNALISEVLPLSMNHFRMHISCWRLLRAVNTAVADDLTRIYGPGYLEHESQLPNVVGMIFMAACNTKKMGKLLKAKKHDAVTTDLLAKAAKAFEGMISAGAGEIECKLLAEGLGHTVDIPDLLDVSVNKM